VAPAQPVGKDRRLPVRVKISERVRESLSNNPAPVGSDPELTQRHTRALDRKQLLARAIERDLLFVALAPAPLFGDL